MSTCIRFDLETLGYWLTMPKNLPGHWLWQVLITLRFLDEQSVNERNQWPTIYVPKVKILVIHFDMSHHDSMWVLIPTFVATWHGAQGGVFLRECKTFNIHHQWPFITKDIHSRPYVGFAQCACHFSKLGPIPKSASLNLVVPVNSNCLTNKNVLFASFCEVSSLLFTIHHWMAESH